MGVYIKGMEMPRSCLDCYFQDCGNCRLNADKVVDKCIIEDRIDDDCPLVPVPPHGRLIDGDYLKHTHCAECTLYPDKCLEKTADGCDWGSIIHLQMCPTIIPSDKEGGDESRT